ISGTVRDDGDRDSKCRNVPPERKESKVSPVASRILAMLSVDGHRSRPSLLTRLDTLKAVGSSPAMRARADTEWPCRRASASIPSQLALCDSMNVVQTRNVILM